MISDDLRVSGGYVVLQRFMVDAYELTGDELVAYAIIYGFCQDGVSACRCSRGYFAYWLGKSKSTVSRVLDSLVAKGFIRRDHEVVDGQTMPRYRLADGAPIISIGHAEVTEMGERDSRPQADGGSACDKGGPPTDPPTQATGEKTAGWEGGPPTDRGSADGPGVRGRVPITDTDTNTESESVPDGVLDSRIVGDYEALKSFMPCTDGYRYGFENYRALRGLGYSAKDISDAAAAMTRALRADYPDRAAKYFPHAQRLLDPGNPQGITAYLPHAKREALREPTNSELYHLAFAYDLGPLTRGAIELNDAIVGAADDRAKNAARQARNRWLAENRAALLEAWRLKKGASR